MKHKHFYAHLVQINELTLDLADLEMTPKERLHLLSLIDANVHSVVIHTVLSELPGDEKKIFLKNIVLNNHKKTWSHLEKNTKNLEEKIQTRVEDLIKNMKQDIRKVKKK